MTSTTRQRPAPGTQETSSTGGTITWTRTGLIHTAGRNFSGRAAEQEARPIAGKTKRG